MSEESITLPPSVIQAGKVIGGYLSVDAEYFTPLGVRVDECPADGGWLVVGNYYGAAIFWLDSKATRIPRPWEP
jgi:hypothetical protein